MSVLREIVLAKSFGNGGEADIDVQPLSVTENGDYNAPSGTAYNPVSVNVPNIYAASDEGKVVSNGELVSQTSQTVTENGTVDTTLVNSLTVDVQGSGGDAYAIARAMVDGTLTEYIDPNVTKVRRGAFTGLPNLSVLKVHNVVSFDARAFDYMSSPLTGVAFLALIAETKGYTFSGLSAPVVDFALCRSFTNTAFNTNSHIKTLVLRSTTVVSLQGATAVPNAFKSGGAGGTIYIPRSLYDHLGDGTNLDYKAATNWSTVDGYGTITWAPIEGSIYETQYADGTPIPTA
jgi:hypothetical protein